MKPLVGTDFCLNAHSGVVVSGKMKVVMDDGQEETFAAGDSFFVPPGHDGWVVGEEPLISYEFHPVAK